MAEVAVVSDCGNLQTELEKAKENLKSVDENIKKLTGRDPAEARALAQQRRTSNIGPVDRGVQEYRARGFGPPIDRRRDGFNDGPYLPKRRALGPLYGRPGGFQRRPRDDDSGDEDYPRRPTVQSSVVATLKEQKTRNDCIKEQTTDEKGMARNRRMFGLLLGTLQKFRVESEEKHEKEQKRVEIEKKLEAIAEKEKEELRKERLELFQERRRRQAELRRLEFKLDMVKQHDEWKKHYQLLQNFIRTKTKPCIFYLPRRHNAASEKRLEETKQELQAMITEKQEKMEEDLAALGKRREVAMEVDEVVSRDIVGGDDNAIRHKRRRMDENGEEDDEDDDEEDVVGEIKDSGVEVGLTDVVGDEMGKVDDVNNESQVPEEVDTKQVEEEKTSVDEVVVTETSVQNEPMVVEEETVKTVPLPSSDDAAIDASAAVAQVAVVADCKNEAGLDILDQTNLTEKEFEPIYD